MLKFACKREREHRLALAAAVRRCYQACGGLLREMMQHFAHTNRYAMFKHLSYNQVHYYAWITNTLIIILW